MMSQTGIALSVALMMAAGLAVFVARAAPAPVAYDWLNVRIGGGGFTPGIAFSTVEPGLWQSWDAGALWLALGGALWRSRDYGESRERSGQAIRVERLGLGKGRVAGMPALYVLGSVAYGSRWMAVGDMDTHQQQGTSMGPAKPHGLGRQTGAD